MIITDPRLLDMNGDLLISRSTLEIDISGGYIIAYSRLPSDPPSKIWLDFILDEEIIYGLCGSEYYSVKYGDYVDEERGDCLSSMDITKEQFIGEIQLNHPTLFEWILWNQLP